MTWVASRVFESKKEAQDWVRSTPGDYVLGYWPDNQFGTEVRVVLHAAGECFDRLYGSTCTGIGIYAPDPFQSDVNADDTYVWACEGVRTGSAMDI